MFPRRFFILFLAAFGVLGMVTMACGSDSGTVVGGTNSAATSAPAKTTHYKVGQQVKIGDTYIVTVNSAKRSGGDVILDVSFKNVSSENQNLSTLIQCDLKDSTGQKLDEDIVGTPPDGTLAAGDTVRGKIAYKAPSGEHKFTFLFEPDAFGSDQAIWDITA